MLVGSLSDFLTDTVEWMHVGVKPSIRLIMMQKISGVSIIVFIMTRIQTTCQTSQKFLSFLYFETTVSKSSDEEAIKLEGLYE